MGWSGACLPVGREFGKLNIRAGMAKLVDALGLGPSAARLESFPRGSLRDESLSRQNKKL
jgi:hypothetical protein